LSSRFLVIKLGGSAITVKGKPLTPRLPIIKKVAEDLVKLYQEGFKFIVVHGGGSYGHPIASKYSLHKGFFHVGQLRGFSETELAMRDINHILASSFYDAGLPVVPMHPSCMVVACKGELTDFYVRPVKLALGLGLIPLLHGDVTMDVKWGFSVISGDQLASFLAISLKADKLIFGMDVKGLFDRDPRSHPEAKLLRRVNVKELNLIDLRVSEGIYDVTGGMRAKLKEALKVASSGIPVYLGSILEKGMVIKMAKGIPGDYTVILP